MRRFGSGLIAVLAFTFAGLGQGVVPQPAARGDVDSVLRGWEKAMTDLHNFTCIAECQTLDKALGSTDTDKGYAMYMKPTNPADGSRAKLVLMNLKTRVEKKYICSGVFMYEYVPAQKLIRVHKMEGKKEQQESFLTFLFGMGANQAKNRYQMELEKTDAAYNYLKILPKLPQDKNDFAQARLALYRGDNLPRQIWYRQPNGTEVTWTITDLKMDLSAMSAKHFFPDQPAGWKVENAAPPAPAALPPNKVRNTSN